MDDVLSFGEAKGDNISIAELDISAVWDGVVVELCAIATLEVDQIGLDGADVVAKLVGLVDEAKLNDGVLFGAAGVLQQVVDDGFVAAKQPARLLVQVDRLDNVALLEDIHPPRL